MSKLDESTIKLMEETFQNEKCCVCNKPAQRFSRSKFYCHDCYPNKRKHVEIKRLKTPKMT